MILFVGKLKFSKSIQSIATDKTYKGILLSFLIYK